MAGYAAGGDRDAARRAAIATAASLVGGGRGRLSMLVPGRGRALSAVKGSVARFDSRTRGGAFGRAWSRSGALGKANTASVWFAYNGFNSGVMRPR